MTEREWDASRYDSAHSFVWERGRGVVDLLAPKPGERILDLGCGTGHLTDQIAESGAEVVGIDSSEDMVRVASENFPHLRFEVADARSLPFECEFDAVFSNAVLHWVRPPEAVVDSVRRALRPGGRFVAEFGGENNIRAIMTAVGEALYRLEQDGTEVYRPNKYFPPLDEYVSLLESRDFRVANSAHFERPTPLDGGEEGMRRWLRMFGWDYLSPLSPSQREEVVAYVEKATRPTLYTNGTWTADYWRIRFEAFKPE
ncbi:MAG: methyltransferase domain-containing protein [Dehalococcoidia bacterium]|nr:methyltransferase domain-containing protein [Dehalococcoidia bacterium]